MCVSINLSRREETMPASNKIDPRIAKALVEALGVDEQDIKPSATLIGDLGAESIDFLDITFRLEREFAIKVHQNELFPQLIILGNSEIVDDGRLTDDGLAALHTQMPYADWRKLERDRRLDRIDDIFTVDLVASYIRSKLGVSAAAKTNGHAPAPHPSPQELNLCANSTGG
jgi:acyl carrier protein